MSNLNSNTMDNKTYNGWFNYATWRINLEIFDGFDAEITTGLIRIAMLTIWVSI